MTSPNQVNAQQNQPQFVIYANEININLSGNFPQLKSGSEVVTSKQALRSKHRRFVTVADQETFQEGDEFDFYQIQNPS